MEVRTNDLYEASYYLVRGCTLDAVEKVRVEGKPQECIFVFSAEDDLFVHLCARWSRGHTDVNLHAFRSAYAQLSGYVHRSKRPFKGLYS